MSMFEMEATSNKKNFKLRGKMFSLEPKAVVLLGANTIYCFKKCSKWKYVREGAEFYKK